LTDSIEDIVLVLTAVVITVPVEYL